MQSFAVVLAAVVAAAQGQIALPAGVQALPAAGLPLGAFPYHAGLAGAYAPHHLGAALPLQYAHAGLPLAAGAAPAPLAYAPVAVPAAPRTYAVPPPRFVEEPAIVETVTEKVEQHGYKIKY